MLNLRPLPPAFLLPAWSDRYLEHGFRTCTRSIFYSQDVSSSVGELTRRGRTSRKNKENPTESRWSYRLHEQCWRTSYRRPVHHQSFRPFLDFCRAYHTTFNLRVQTAKTLTDNASRSQMSSGQISSSHKGFYLTQDDFKTPLTSGNPGTEGSNEEKEPRTLVRRLYTTKRSSSGTTRRDARGVLGGLLDDARLRRSRSFRQSRPLNTEFQWTTEQRVVDQRASLKRRRKKTLRTPTSLTISFNNNVPKHLDKNSDKSAIRARATELQRELQRLESILKQNETPFISPLDTQRISEDAVDAKTHRQLTLLEQLFPGEAKKKNLEQAVVKNRALDNTPGFTDTVDRAIDDEHQDADLAQININQVSFGNESAKTSRVASVDIQTELFKEWDLTIMIISGLSTGLSNSDFQRIIPRGKHIEEWRGPGDVLKVIPLRNSSTLDHRGGYLLVFVNPAYARAYKTHIEHLHQLAREHTPSQPHDSPFPSQVSSRELHFNDTNLQQSLNDYALCPPSQELSCRIIFPPYGHQIRRILANKGYEQITQPEDATLRSVLLSVSNHVPTFPAMKQWLKNDGLRRGRSWSVSLDDSRFKRLKGVGKVIDGPPDEGSERLEAPELADRTNITRRKWILIFDDEPEARRFVRTWHMRPWPAEELKDVQDEKEMAPIVSAEVLW